MLNGIGHVMAKNLIAYVGSVEGVFKEKKQTLAKIPGIGEVRAKAIANHQVLERADKEVEFLIKNNLSTHFFLDANYPHLLKECADGPILLYGKGNLPINRGKFVSIVGTRQATEEGKENCRKLIFELAAYMPQITIVSGLAYGIDITAHKAALEAGVATIIIPAHGLDRVYPAAHRSVALKSMEQGGMLTEFLSGTTPDRQNFVQRNRIIAGLSDALVVIESKENGGSLITAEIANSYNRDVFAFAGRSSDVASRGCNNLIKRNGAALIDGAEDLLSAMRWECGVAKPIQATIDYEMEEHELQVIALLRASDAGMQLNDLARKMQMSVAALSSTLLQMEFKGLVKPFPGNLYRICK